MTRGFELAVKTVEKLSDNSEKVTYWDSKLPVRATAHSAGYDFFAAEDINIPSVWGPLVQRLFIKHTDGSKNETHAAYLRKNFKGDTEAERQESIEKVHKRFRPVMIHTGIKAYMPKNEALFLFNRSSNPGKLGLVLANGVGVVDSDYYSNPSNDGEIMFAFYNYLPWTVKIKKGDKVGQGVFMEYRLADGDKSRGKRNGGFGSSDKPVEKKVEADKPVEEQKEPVQTEEVKAEPVKESTVTITEE